MPITSSTFQNLHTQQNITAVFGNNSQIEIKQCLFNNCSIASMIYMDSCNANISDTTISQNHIECGYLGIGLVTAKDSIISIVNSNIGESDTTDQQHNEIPKEHILHFETTTLFMDNCTFSSNNVSTARHLIHLDSFSTGFINNPRFTGN